ncbi:MAG TPA: hypothetical protein VK253_02780 [Candidatus Binatia bacterium]|nr:hypothetical protein [Candidatus Binatia bacterium]
MKPDKKNIKEMGFEGAGPKIMLPMFLTAAIAAVASYSYRPLFSYPVTSVWTLFFGALFLVIGVPFGF